MDSAADLYHPSKSSPCTRSGPPPDRADKWPGLQSVLWTFAGTGFSLCCAREVRHFCEPRRP